MDIKLLENEYWYGGAAHFGHAMPYDKNSNVTINLITGEGILDQYSPLYFSTKGRYIHSSKPFVIEFRNGTIHITGDAELSEGHGTLKGAQLAAAKKHFRLSGEIPDESFFTKPQYNTWIELMYNQNQKQILEYARSLKSSGMPSGILMIDEGWAPDYGVFDFCPRKFSDPGAMTDELHALGFKVMLWITPHISPDSDCFRELRNTDYLIKDKNGDFAVREWWNGYSCILDLSNPAACNWFRERLEKLMDTYGIDGFKFDAGGAYLYRSDDKTHVVQEACEHTKTFDSFGGSFKFNELRSVWDCGGLPVVCRLQDKAPQWDERGLGAIIPNMLAQGLLGYFFGCPDMIGGGDYGGFTKEGFQTDEELYLRWLEASVLCPMMQFSISPKRILSPEAYNSVLKITEIHTELSDTIIKLAKNAAVTGEPIMRYMEYEFPGQGFEKVTDQFMLGDEILVAPVLRKGCTQRTVKLPSGCRIFRGEEELSGGKNIIINAAADELPIFRLRR